MNIESSTSQLLKMSARQIREEYQALKRHVYSLSEDDRWIYGAALKRLKAAFFVAQESEQVRSA